MLIEWSMGLIFLWVWTFRFIVSSCFILLVSVICLVVWLASLHPMVWYIALVADHLASVAILLAWHFNKGRKLLIHCSVAFDSKIVWRFNSRSVHYGTSYWWFLFLYCLFGVVPERGFFNRSAVNRILFVVDVGSWCYAMQRMLVSSLLF